MSKPDQVLSTLTNLCAEDRAWLVGKLSVRQRQALMDLANGESDAAPERVDVRSPSISAAKAASDARDTLRCARSGEVFALLQGEPAWFVASVLALEEWPWKAEFVQLLPSPMRANVMQVAMRPMPEAVRKLVLAQCVESLSSVNTSLASDPKPAWLARLRTLLVDRRLVIRS